MHVVIAFFILAIVRFIASHLLGERVLFKDLDAEMQEFAKRAPLWAILLGDGKTATLMGHASAISYGFIIGAWWAGFVVLGITMTLNFLLVVYLIVRLQRQRDRDRK
jgi:asparagine N-glycosylation enzyme membrane subunit Stt3